MLYTHIKPFNNIKPLRNWDHYIVFTNGWFLAESKLFLYWISTAEQRISSKMWKWTGTKQLFDKRLNPRITKTTESFKYIS